MVLYYYAAAGTNFGDCLSPVVVNSICARPLSTVNGFRPSRWTRLRSRLSKRLLAIGSIVHHSQDGDIIWGSGINPHWHDKWERKLRRPPKLDVRAVRGPLTRQYLTERMHISCPRIYGDPALLLKHLSADLTPQPKRRFGVVPHYRDVELLSSSDAAVISPLRPWRDVVDFILESELVISTSLHGIVVAEALGVPARWLHDRRLPSAATEGTFKFNDYFLGTNRTPDDYASSLEDALRLAGKEPVPPDISTNLLQAFPMEVKIPATA